MRKPNIPDMPLEGAELEKALENSMALSSIQSIARASERMIGSLRDYNEKDPAQVDENGQLKEPTYSMKQAAKMLGKTASTLRKAEQAGKIPVLPKLPNGRKDRYTLSQVNQMRKLWDCCPHRAPDSAPIKLSFQNFKGGVAKTTLSVLCAQYLASMGYRVLLIDADSQGSATSSFGFRPDVDLEPKDTLALFLTDDADDLRSTIRPTRWDGLDIIPACLGLYGAEYYLAAIAGQQAGSDDVAAASAWIERLDDGIETVADDYDIIIIDPPPALGMISLSVLRSIDGLIIPTPPSMYDFHSTSSFFNMLEEIMTELVKHYGEELVEIEFVKILIAKKTGKKSSLFISDLLTNTFGANVLKNEFLESAEIGNAASRWKSVYDLDGATASGQTYKRCIENLDAIFGEVESLIQTVWLAREAKKRLEFGVPSETMELQKNDEFEPA